MESKRELNGKDLAQLSNHLDKLTLWILHSRGTLSKHELAQQIFASKGLSPNPEHLESLLQSFVKDGLVKKGVAGFQFPFVTRFSLTEAGKEAVTKASVELKNGERLLSD